MTSHAPHDAVLLGTSLLKSEHKDFPLLCSCGHGQANWPPSISNPSHFLLCFTPPPVRPWAGPLQSASRQSRRWFLANLFARENESNQIIRHFKISFVDKPLALVGYASICDKHCCGEDEPGIMSSWRWCWQRSIILRPLYTLAALFPLRPLWSPPPAPVQSLLIIPHLTPSPPHPHTFSSTINNPPADHSPNANLSLIDNIFPIRSSMITPFGETGNI